METVTDFLFLGSEITSDGGCSREIKRCLLLRKKVMTNVDSILKSRDITSLTKVCLVKALVFPVVMYGCKSLAIKKAEHQKLMLLNCGLEKTLKSPLDCKIKPVNPKGNQSWIFIGRTDAEADAPILWPPDSKSWLIGKDPDAGKDWRQEEKRTIEDEVVNMASLTRWTWVWTNSGSWWWTGEPGMLQSTGLQRVRHDWVTKQNWMSNDAEHLVVFMLTIWIYSLEKCLFKFLVHF